MCGIVGLFLKNTRFEDELGQHLATMLEVMSDRGPDSAGFAVYGKERAGFVKLTLKGPNEFAWPGLEQYLREKTSESLEVRPRDSHAVLVVPAEHEPAARLAIKDHAPFLSIVGVGESLEIYKDVGLPGDVAARFHLSEMTGTHGIGHTRMATESAVTTKGAHPFSTGADQCLVHNGSLSNHNSLRRELARDGMSFETDNDSEVAASYLTNQMRKGADLGGALERSLRDLDGFYTFVVGTKSGFGVLRDPIACKPAVMAETSDYVAFGSEYRALAVLPGVQAARVWEPEPAKVYFWERRS